VQRDKEARDSSLENLERDLKEVQKAQQKHQGQFWSSEIYNQKSRAFLTEKMRSASRAKGLVLSEEDMAEYRNL